MQQYAELLHNMPHFTVKCNLALEEEEGGGQRKWQLVSAGLAMFLSLCQ